MSNLTLSLIVISTFILKIVACDAIVPKPPNDIKSLHFSMKTTFRTLGVGYCRFADALAHCPRKQVLFQASQQRLVLLYHSSLLISNSYSPEPNPGPANNGSATPQADSPQSYAHSQSNHSSWICGTCDLAVSWGSIGVACNQCGQLFHGHCQSTDTIYNHELGQDVDKPWYCAICGSPNSQMVFDLHGADWTPSTFSDLSLNASCTTPTDLQLQPQHSSTLTCASQQDKWKDRPLRVLDVNFQLASAKRAEIPNLLDSLKPDVILGTETWLDPSISNSEILPSLYNVYRKDRGGKGGAVLIAVRNTLDSSAAPELEVEDCELLWIRVKLKGRCTLYLYAYYRPNVADETSLRKRGQSLERASQSSSPHWGGF